MRSKFWMVLAGLMVVAAPLAAQERDREAGPRTSRTPTTRRRPEPALRLRCWTTRTTSRRSTARRGSGRGFLLDEGQERGGNAYRDPYSIASYYRGGSRGGYSYGRARLATTATASSRVSGYSGRSRGLRYRRHIGENGDLFFFAPAILAPVGPLSEVFLSGR
jgi:hypothetical protein